MADMRGIANTYPLPTRTPNGVQVNAAMDRLGDLMCGDLQGLASRMAQAGRMVLASDADQNDTVTGQTSFANTTPTFLLNVPSGSAAVPLWFRLYQTGSAAGGAVTVLAEIDDIAAYSSGGTAETQLHLFNGGSFTTSCQVYSGATATAGYGVGIYHKDVVGTDTTPAIGDLVDMHLLHYWVAPFIMPIKGPGSLKIFTHAGTTGPTWYWSIAYLDVPADMFG